MLQTDKAMQRGASAQENSHPDMVLVPGGTFRMGSDKHYPEEAPAHRFTVDAFRIDKTPVTNRQFKEFVRATGHVTIAEIVPDQKDYPGALPQMIYAGSLVFTPPDHPVDLRNWGEWWTFLRGANWRRPYGPKSNINVLDNHPVVHVAYADVLAYARWAGKDLPTEAEWEFAARGGLEEAEFAWGEQMPDGKHMANTWQGNFPHQNLAVDGFERTSPVTAFPANGYGLHDMIGNVWNGRPIGIRRSMNAMRRKRVAFRKILAVGPRPRATTLVSRRSGFRARCLRAARTSALPTIAAAIVRPRVMPSRSTPQQAMSASGASPGRGSSHE